jgi:hypothetical protein
MDLPFYKRIAPIPSKEALHITPNLLPKFGKINIGAWVNAYLTPSKDSSH